MELSRIQPNCSECAIIVYRDKLTESQLKLFTEFCAKKGLFTKKTKKGNLAIELNYGEWPSNKSDLWDIADNLELISDWDKKKIEREVHFDLIRDESYEEMLENGGI